MKNNQQNYSDGLIYFPLRADQLGYKVLMSGLMKVDQPQPRPAEAPPQPYQDVLAVSRPYFGPAVKRFIDRQIRNHLAKRPQTLTASDLPLLVDWIKVSVTLLTEDRELITEYIEQLDSLTAKHTAVR